MSIPSMPIYAVVAQSQLSRSMDLTGAIVAGVAGKFAGDESFDLRSCRFLIVAISSVIPDMRVRRIARRSGPCRTDR